MNVSQLGQRIDGAALAIGLMLPQHAAAHPGGLDSQGCHHNRKTGDYHCHRAPAIQRPQHAAAAASQPASAVAQPQQSTSTAPTCHTGPRGGRYTITKSGKKNYHGC